MYRAFHTQNGIIVAIKRISIYEIPEEQLKPIHMEIDLLKKLSHPNIVKYIGKVYLDCINSNKHLNIVLEYVESGSLSAIAKRFKGFSESLISIYIKQVLQGLVYLHEQGIVHRDIKGANILTTKEGIVKLTDFGVATKLTESTKRMSIVGTPYWMAPEIAYPSGSVTPACDVWSLGCTVLELFTGSPPYYELEPMQALFRIVQDDCPPIPDSVSGSLNSFLLKCFQKEPLIRVTAKELLEHSWINKIPTPQIEESMPEEISNSIRYHMESISEMPENLVQHRRSEAKVSNDLAKEKRGSDNLSKSTGFTSDELLSNASLKKFRESRQVSADSVVGFHSEDYRNFESILKNYNVHSTENLIVTQVKLLEKLKSNYELTETPSLFADTKEILEGCCDASVLHLSLQILNLLCENNSEAQEKICSIGLAQKALSFVGEEYPRELRVEAAYLAGQLCHSTEFVSKLFMCSGGLEAVPKLLDSNFPENKDLLVLGIDCMLTLMEHDEELVLVWGKSEILYRVAVSIMNLANHEYLYKACEILLAFVKGPKHVQAKVCELENLSVLLNSLKDMKETGVSKVTKAIYYLSTEESLQNVSAI